MANNMIALQARAPQMPGMGDAIRQNAQMINMMMQQRVAERQAAQAQQKMDIEAKIAKPQLAKAEAEATTARVKTVSDFLDFSIAGLKMARNLDDAVKIGEWMKSQFSNPELQAAVDQTVATLTSDPAQFENNRQQMLYQSMDAKDQLEQQFTTQNLGTQTRVVSAPKYAGAPGGMAATEVPGSRADVAFKPTVVNVEGLGAVIVDPNTGMGFPAAAGPTGGFTRTTPGTGGPGLVVGERGGEGPVARALQTNPGAIKDGNFARSQPGYVGASGGFAMFDTPQAGVAAQENLLRNSYVGKGFNTINKIINRYAPPGAENSAEAVANYKTYVAQRTGIDVNAPISPAQISTVAKAMREFETGNRSGVKAGGKGVQTTEQAASAQEKARKVKTFQDITGVNLETGVDPVAKLIEGSTSGLVETLGAELVGALPEGIGGGATPGMEKIGQLETLSSTLTLAFAPGGRLSTGVSNEDRAKIEQQLGRIEDPTVPAGKRLAAWREVKRIMARSIGISGANQTKPAGKAKPSLNDIFKR